MTLTELLEGYLSLGTEKLPEPMETLAPGESWSLGLTPGLLTVDLRTGVGAIEDLVSLLVVTMQLVAPEQVTQDWEKIPAAEGQGWGQSQAAQTWLEPGVPVMHLDQDC